MPRLPATLDRDIDTSLPCSGPTPLAPPVLTRSLATAANQPVKRFVRLPLQRESSSLVLVRPNLSVGRFYKIAAFMDWRQSQI